MLLLIAVACSDYEFAPGDDVADGVTCADGAIEAPTEVATDSTCTFEAETGQFNPTVEWQWTGSANNWGYDNVMMMPAVGDVDADGSPEVVIASYSYDRHEPGVLTILDGQSGREERSFTTIGGHEIAGSGGIALGDLEGDGTPEIVFLTPQSTVVVAQADGGVVWSSSAASWYLTDRAYPAIADMDGDGFAEVIVGGAVFSHTGELLGTSPGGNGGSAGIPVLADLDGVGKQEAIVSNAAWDKFGNAIWTNNLPEGWVAVGDMDLDGQGEVAVVTDGSLYLLDTDGSVMWGPKSIKGSGGPPTIADFDGDGTPEIGVAGQSNYVVFETEGWVLWTASSTDVSSSSTGSSVFDFEGDGAWEVLYADEQMMWVFDGATGAPIMSHPHSSGTLYEYPVVADVDGDDEAEIIFASNEWGGSNYTGVTVLGDAGRTWAPTTRTWNQHAYHITNVHDDLSIPASPQMNWELGHNSFRAGGMHSSPGNPAPNLRPELLEVCWSCGTDAYISATIVNTGNTSPSATVGLSLSAKMADGSLQTIATRTVDAPAYGRSTGLLTFEATHNQLSNATHLVMSVDAGQRVMECDEDDNTIEIQLEACDRPAK